mmetsp:Transcript_53677/g.122947  ORF Transcript_53677/g.122947 Transcript_53677/m.122947 type:complete len:90 (+) Transcript_53677:238-507(+)
MASTNPQFQGWIPWKRLRGKVVNQILAAVFFVFAVLCVFVATKDSPVTLLGSEFLVVAVAFGLYHLVDKLLLRQNAPAEDTAEDASAIE